MHVCSHLDHVHVEMYLACTVTGCAVEWLKLSKEDLTLPGA